MNGLIDSTFGQLLSWARGRSLWFYSTGAGCCADEVLSTLGCKYDLERFGCVPQVDPRQADLLIVNGFINLKATEELKKIYQLMVSPKYVLAIGACACGGGAFHFNQSYMASARVQDIIPVDVFVPGCPPRPEAVMNGLLALQEKISGKPRFKKSR